MARLKDRNWNLSCLESDSSFSVDHIRLALLMDIRDELKEFNARFRCQNFLGMPWQLELTRKGVEGLRRDLKETRRPKSPSLNRKH